MASSDTVGECLRINDVCIMNTDFAGGQGVHWLAVMGIGNEALIFDPLGKNNKRYNSKMQLVDLNIYQSLYDNGYKNIQFWDGVAQYDDSEQCGFISILAGKIMRASHNIADAYKKIMEVFGLNADLGDLAISLESY